MSLADVIGKPPGSAVFIFLLTVCMISTTALVTTKITDQTKLRRYRKEISEWNKMRQTAQKTGDEKLALEVRRRSKIIQNMQKQVSSQSLKPSLIFLVPFLAIFIILSAFYGHTPVAAIPYNLGGLEAIPLIGPLIYVYTAAAIQAGHASTYVLSYIGWYLICSFSLQAIINRLFGVSLGGLGGPGMAPFTPQS